MNPAKDFEEIKLHPLNVLNGQDEDLDRDLNYFNEMPSKNFGSSYFLEENTKRYLCDIEKHENLSLIHVSIRSMSSFFGKLRDFLINCSNSANLICITTETWCTDKDCKDNLNFYSQSFDFIDQERKTGNERRSNLI